MAARRLATVFCLLAIAASAQAQFASDHDRREALRHYRNGQEFMSGERFEQAAEEFKAAIVADHLLTLAHYGLGQAYMEMRRFASAVKAFGECRAAFRELY